MAETIADDQRVLREGEERFRTLFEQASDLFELTDLEGRLLGVNSATCRSLGYTRDELLRLSLEDIDPQFDRGQFAAAGREIPPPASVTVETTHRRKDGSVFPVEVQQSVIQIGGAARVLLVVRDITERKRAQEESRRLQLQLSQAQKMESVGRLSGGVAHNLNNMLTVILGHTEIAVNQVDTAKPIHHDLVQIQKAAQRSADLTSELLAFARRQMAASRVLDLNETVAKMLKRLKRVVGEDITLAWIPAPDLWPVRIDPTQIEQILAKLCANARDAIDGTGKVTIETRNVLLDESYCRNHPGAVVGACAALVVSDTGCGIARDVIGSVFEPFFTTKGPGRGTGLGLAAVYGIVKQNDGWIYVDSEPGRGATFTVYLPRLAGVTADAAVAASPDTPRVH
jgi:two-component system cell cycle sensor histidine kinase/response regulator CckA